jgi:hypothetical protein
MSDEELNLDASSTVCDAQCLQHLTMLCGDALLSTPRRWRSATWTRPTGLRTQPGSRASTCGTPSGLWTCQTASPSGAAALLCPLQRVETQAHAAGGQKGAVHLSACSAACAQGGVCMRKHTTAVAVLGAGVGCRKSQSGWMARMPRGETGSIQAETSCVTRLFVGQGWQLNGR